LGTTDAAYDGSGTGEACAFNHPHWAIPNVGQGSTATNVDSGGTVVIHGPEAGTGEYRMGCQDVGDCREATVNITNAACDSSWSYDCGGNPIADGIDVNNPTTIIGCSTTGCNGGTRPILWAAGRTGQVLNTNGTDNILIKDIEITDHAAGLYPINASCNSGSSSLSGLHGIYANSGSNQVLNNVYIHGMCMYGLKIGGVNGLTLQDVVIDKNGWSGWSLDSCAGAGTCGMSGTITIDNTQITYSGCAEDYPGTSLLAAGCHAQADGIISDGIESANGAGTWVITDSNISHNTHDGIDLLYINGGAYSGGTVSIKRTLTEGNGGNQIKGPNQIIVEDSAVLGNCGYFTGQAFASATWDDVSDSCRAYGSAIAISFRDDDTVPKLINNTIFSNGDTGILTSGTCTAGTDVIVANNIMVGGREHADDTAFIGGGGNDTSSIYYNADGTCAADFVETYNKCANWKEGSAACNGTGSTDTVYPSLVGGTIAMGPDSSPGYYSGANMITDVYLSAADGASDETVSGADSLDYNSFDRGPAWDQGALEYGSVPTEESGTGGFYGSIKLTGSLSVR
jgi:hypothetical protein